MPDSAKLLIEVNVETGQYWTLRMKSETAGDKRSGSTNKTALAYA
jgi:hypothetical protein